jgi:hypothetical protein
LGQHLALLLDLQHVDVDDYYWLPTNPPFTTKRPPNERVSLMHRELGEDDWVLSGSCINWGDALIAHADLIVFVVTPTPIRLERLAARESNVLESGLHPAVICMRYMWPFESGPRSTTIRAFQDAIERGTRHGYRRKRPRSCESTGSVALNKWLRMSFTL